MPPLRTHRHQQQRRASFVRWTMLLVLLSVAAAGMPRWIVHAHTAGHAPVSVVALDGYALDTHQDDAGHLAEPNLDNTHLHGHYIGGFSSLLPSMFMSVPGHALPAQSCPPGEISSPCEGHLATLHRPPIV